jgi:hypothetical protein
MEYSDCNAGFIHRVDEDEEPEVRIEVPVAMWVS